MQLLLDTFAPIGLAELNGAELLNRKDTKFAFPEDLLADFLLRASNNYRALEVSGLRQGNYESLYFDTNDLRSYYFHHNGNFPRNKFRYRCYTDSNVSFFEIKTKDNRRRTIKKRISVPGIPAEAGLLGEAEKALVAKVTSIHPDQLRAVIWSHFTRITLVNKYADERITLDYDLRFTPFRGDLTRPVWMPGLAVAEVKQDTGMKHSPFLDIFNEVRLRPMGISKYTLGMAICQPDLKRNRFKPKFLKLSKQLDDGFYHRIALGNH